MTALAHCPECNMWRETLCTLCRATRTPGAVNLGGGIEPSGNSCAPADFLQPVEDAGCERIDALASAQSGSPFHGRDVIND